MCFMYFFAACIEPPSIQSSVGVEIQLESRMFQYGSLEGILIDEKQSPTVVNEGTIYVSTSKIGHVDCLSKYWNSNQRVIIVSSENDVEKAMNYLKQQGLVIIDKENYPCP